MAKLLKKIESVGEGAQFIVRTTNAETGKVSLAETFTSEKPMKQTEVASVINAEFKAGPSRRHAWLSMLAVVFADPKLDGYKGKGDVKAGTVSKEFKASVRSVEEAYLRGLCSKEGGIKLHVGKDENAESKLMEFCTSVREDKNYSNVKAHVSKYFAYVGAHPVTKSGYLVPVPVMMAEVQTLLDQNKQQPDNSYKAQLLAILDAMNKDTNMDIEDASAAVSVAKQIHSTLAGIIAHQAELTTHAMTAAGVGLKEATQAVIDTAKQEAKGKAKATA